MKSQFLAIDKDRLDEEWLEQPSKYFIYAQRLADAKRVYDNASNKESTTYAMLSSKVRANPKKYFGSTNKPTEGAINAKVVRLTAYREAQQEKIDAKYDVDVLQAACTALEHRRRALTDLVQLHLSSYFAESKPKGKGMRDMADDAIMRNVVKRTHREDREDS